MKRPERSKVDRIQVVSAAALAKAAALIAAGGIVALPTETSYGLAVDPFNEQALRRLFAVKQRSRHKPVLVLIDGTEWLRQLAAAIPACYRPLLATYWPGPLTMIFPAVPLLSPWLTGATATVGIRVSSDPVANGVCRAVGGPITATSANISGMEPARSAEQIYHQFGDTIDLILDDGERNGGKCSTVITQEGGELRLIRAGRIDFSLLTATGMPIHGN
ncbi:L-threonylcarbamoyladenylate synthase [Desulfofustis glycolicus]|uniref:L-threonylcarbamoyladenylate synthase n=1 Tax=Desulfofustis glycolicus DSM 9705 TaxID=1121409 RepID=A0A1M5U3I7_9BACT|nr:L-threonylcarbamoyladenylate synthase [Desulfofustis glycolicus]MCB2214669.1 threonylcarbamoyl-AMP synthase [Desulfobulbaceae bacterium]SHH57665.1 translation factor SUA5 [Desulfofustis glycolicus DSM 9705]